MTLIAECVRSLLPDLNDRHAVEVSALHAAADQPVDALIRLPPLQTPGPASSVTGMVGGRRPGAVSLAHCGVLLLHDAPDFAPVVLHALRQPLDVQLVATSRLCPCSTTHTTGTGCSAPARRRYRTQMHSISDRLDIAVTVEPAASVGIAGESIITVAARVVTARAATAARWAQEGFATNAEISIDVLRQPAFRIPASATSALQRMLDAGQLSTRAYGAILRLAWTVSDLRGAGRPDKEAVDTAVELDHPRRHTD